MRELSRRNFMKTSLSGALAGGALSGFGCGSNSRSISEIGLQVYTIRDQIAEDWQAALRRVAEIGYDTIESGALYGGDINSHLDFLKEVGLKNISGGGGMADLESGLLKIIDDSLTVGRKYVVCFWPWSDTFTAKTPDVWQKIAAQLNLFGEACQKNGLVFAYHNHDLEFVQGEEIQPYDILLQNTDPAFVTMEVDLYWMRKGGEEPADYLQKYPGRFPLWHVKDMADDADHSFACVGDGIIDFAALFSLAETAGLQHIFVEQDKPKDAMACIESSYNYLKTMRY
jgi:sugar phosphate isomerase/epimerase